MVEQMMRSLGIDPESIKQGSADTTKLLTDINTTLQQICNAVNLLCWQNFWGQDNTHYAFDPSVYGIAPPPLDDEHS